ncbi:TRAP transporter small permease [Vandammella animalimorsus]|uniref:TRAP transporter small permease subunit n=1 Tax=Vandammella animalimorsus TaxID=2029117 RepID=UPI0031BAF9A4
MSMHTHDTTDTDQPLPAGWRRLTQALNALGTLWIVALMLLINADVIGRSWLGMPVRGVTELVSLSIVGIVFLQLADTLAAGRMTHADILLGRLQRSRPAWAAILQAVYHLAGALLMGIIVWAAWQPLVESIRIQEHIGAVGDFTAPVWPVRLVMLIGMGTTLFTFLLLALQDMRRIGKVPRSMA